MATIYLRCAKESNQSVRVLTELIQTRGHQVVRTPPQDGSQYFTVCWGHSSPLEERVVNGKVNKFSKLEALERFSEAGLNTPRIVLAGGSYTSALRTFPQLARKPSHKAGRDVIVCHNLADARRAVAKGRTYFSEWIPTTTEYRVWVWRKRIIGVYEKQFTGRGEYKGYLRNHRFGFHFERREDLRESPKIMEVSVRAVKALELDFGAVDIILGKDGNHYVLEVNSMPNIDDGGRSTGIRLASAIIYWAENYGHKTKSRPSASK